MFFIVCESIHCMKGSTGPHFLIFVFSASDVQNNQTPSSVFYLCSQLWKNGFHSKEQSECVTVTGCNRCSQFEIPSWTFHDSAAPGLLFKPVP